MNPPLVPTCLKRQGRIRRHALRMSPANGQLLHMIPELSDEEDMPYLSTPSSSRCSSPTTNSELSTKAQRRQGNLRLSHIYIPNVCNNKHLNTHIFSAPRPAPLPPSSPHTTSSGKTLSPRTPPRRNCFQLNLNQMAYDFPQPPIPTPSLPSLDSDMSSLSSSSSSTSTSPISGSFGLPSTPATSDDEFFASPSVVKPLVITKRRPAIRLRTNEQEADLPSNNDYDSDSEDACHWYAREFSKIYTLSSPIPALSLMPRPESMLFSPTTYGESHRLYPGSSAQPSAQLDPACPLMRHSVCPPPSASSQSERPRPPPRISVPADFDDEEGCFPSSPSQLSYESTPLSLGDDGECEIQFDLDVHFEVDIDRPMSLPLSLPGSPIDLEADITQAFEALRASNDPPPSSSDDIVPYDVPAFPSRWSSSTSSSTFSAQQDSQRHSSASPSKLRLYLSGLRSKKAPVNTHPKPVYASPPMKSHKEFRGAFSESDSDVMLIGYEDLDVAWRGGMGRRSTTDGQSGCSENTINSSGALHRKPIPIEMFWRDSQLAC